MGAAIAGRSGARHELDLDGRPHLYLVPPLPRQRTRETAAAERPAPSLVPSQVRTPVRLTRRGRVVVVLFLLSLMIGIALLLSTASQASAPSGPVRTVVVHPGDTLWSIATAALPGVEPDVAVDRVRRLNHMNDNAIYVGEQLTLPPTR